MYITLSGSGQLSHIWQNPVLTGFQKIESGTSETLITTISTATVKEKKKLFTYRRVTASLH